MPCLGKYDSIELQQEDSAKRLIARRRVIFRIPLPLQGL